MKWNLFKIFKKKEKDLTWDDVSYKTFKKIQEADSEADDEKEYAIMQAIYGEEVFSLPLPEYKAKLNRLKKLFSPVPNDLHVDKVTVNGTTYVFSGVLGDITTAQYIDFMNHAKNKDELKMYSVFFIPKGHKYNDGYDMLQVFKDLEEFPITILNSTSFFFNRQLDLFNKIFQRSLVSMMKKKKLPKTMIKAMKDLLGDYNNLEYYRMLLDSVK